MDRPRDESGPERRQTSDSSPEGGSAPDLASRLSAQEARLDQIERLLRVFDQRLQAIESRLHHVETESKASEPATILAASPRQHPYRRQSPLRPIRRRPLPLLSLSRPAQSLLDELFTRQPGSLPATTRTPPRPAPPSQRAFAAKRPALAMADLERAVSGRGLAWAGGLSVLLGALFFLSLAMSRGWIGVETRVVIGLVAGIVVTILGDRLMRGGDRVLGPVLVAVGIGIWNLALVAGTRLYDFVPTWAALLGAAAGAVVATAIAIRANAQIIALYGVVTALAAPMLFAVPAATTPMAFLVVVLAGSTAIAIARGWSWLPPVAFVLTTLQFYSWWIAANAPEQIIVPVIGGLSLLHAIAAAGVAVWDRTGRSTVTAVVLLVLNTLFLAFIAASTLADQRIALGVVLLGGVAAHAALGRFVRHGHGGTTAFATSSFGIAVILLAGAIAAFFDGPAVVIAWTAEALGLIWLATRYQNTAGYAGAALVFSLALLHLFSYEFPPSRLGLAPRSVSGIPFVNEAGLTLLAMLGMLAMAGRIVRQHVARVAIAVIGLGLLIAVLPREVAGIGLLTGWCVVAVLAIAGDRYLDLVAPSSDPPLSPALAWFAANGQKAVAAVAAALAIWRAVVYEMPIFTSGPFAAGASYAGQPVTATAIIVIAALAAAAMTTSDTVRHVAGSVAILITAYLAAFMLDPAPAVAVWAILAVVAAILQDRAREPLGVYSLTSGLLLVAGLAVALSRIAPPSRLLLTGGAPINHPILWSEATLALGALTAAFLAIAWMVRGTAASTWLTLGGGVLAVYLLSIGIVDEFQSRVDDAAGVAELRRQSQVALSVVWAMLGGIAVAAGLVRAIAPLRWLGLGLLTLATVKVFLFDMASLDAAYRVLSFIVLGILLLLSSYAYRRLGRAGGSDSIPGDGTAPAEIAHERGQDAADEAVES